MDRSDYHDDAGHLRGPHPVDFELVTVDPLNLVAPFPVKRVYWVYDTTPGVIRGKHSHKALRQLAVAVAGSCTFTLESAGGRSEVVLDDPTKGLLIGPGVWREMKDFSPGCVLTVLASLPYDESDYIRDYAEFCQA